MVDAMDNDNKWCTAKVEWVDNREGDSKMYMIRVKFENGQDLYIGVHTVRI